LNNLLADGTNSTSTLFLGRSLEQVRNRLDALLLVVKSCKGTTCSSPWTALHPLDDVTSLTDALDPKFDTFYHHQPKVSYSECSLGYIVDLEGPQTHNVYEARRARRGSLGEGYDWSFWE
jgi:arylsulfatase